VEVVPFLNIYNPIYFLDKVGETKKNRNQINTNDKWDALGLSPGFCVMKRVGNCTSICCCDKTNLAEGNYYYCCYYYYYYYYYYMGILPFPSKCRNFILNELGIPNLRILEEEEEEEKKKKKKKQDK